MEFKLDISKDIVVQFRQLLNADSREKGPSFESEYVKFNIQSQIISEDLEFHSIHLDVKSTFQLNPFSPEDSEWYLLHISLSKNSLVKSVNSQIVELKKFAPAGMLLYTPNTRAVNKSNAGERFQIAIVRFSKKMLLSYYQEEIKAIENPANNIIYEDLDYRSEEILKRAIENIDSKINVHAEVLSLMSIFIEKLKKRESGHAPSRMHPDDIKKLFLSASYLRNPLAENIPSIKELASKAEMGTTKFKTTFKLVFGCPPIQYHQKIKMEYAKEALRTRKKTPSQLSYELGYSHPSKFTQAYKKRFGELPSKY